MAAAHSGQWPSCDGPCRVLTSRHRMSSSGTPSVRIWSVCLRRSIPPRLRAWCSSTRLSRRTGRWRRQRPAGGLEAASFAPGWLLDSRSLGSSASQSTGFCAATEECRAPCSVRSPERRRQSSRDSCGRLPNSQRSTGPRFRLTGPAREASGRWPSIWRHSLVVPRRSSPPK